MIKTFADLELDPILLEAIEEMGFSRPTQVQAEASRKHWMVAMS